MIGLDRGGLQKQDWRSWALRFGFGFGIAVVAGAAGLRFGARIGGLFLAFPAILPASLTLIEEKDSRKEAEIDATGAILGGVALGIFGAVTALLVTRLHPGLALAAALAAWAVTAVALYAVASMISTSRSRERSTATGSPPSGTGS